VSVFTDIASVYLAQAAPLAASAASTTYPDGSDAIPVAEALNDSVQRTIWNTNRLKEEA